MSFSKEIFNTVTDSSGGLVNKSGKIKREKPIAKKIIDEDSNAFEDP